MRSTTFAAIAAPVAFAVAATLSNGTFADAPRYVRDVTMAELQLDRSFGTDDRIRLTDGVSASYPIGFEAAEGYVSTTGLNGIQGQPGGDPTLPSNWATQNFAGGVQAIEATVEAGVGVGGTNGLVIGNANAVSGGVPVRTFAFGPTTGLLATDLQPHRLSFDYSILDFLTVPGAPDNLLGFVDIIGAENQLNAMGQPVFGFSAFMRLAPNTTDPTIIDVLGVAESPTTPGSLALFDLGDISQDGTFTNLSLYVDVDTDSIGYQIGNGNIIVFDAFNGLSFEELLVGSSNTNEQGSAFDTNEFYLLDNFDVGTGVSLAVPEPTSLGLLSAGALMLIRRRK